jgi:hypothetical protein
VKRDYTALVAYLNERRTRPYEWGSDKNDCVSFIDGAIQAATGKSALGKLKWKSRATAISTLNRLGGMGAALDARFERIPLAQAHRGDIAGVPTEALVGIPDEEAKLIGLHPMVVEGATLVATSETGLVRVPRNKAAIAWSITARKP